MNHEDANFKAATNLTGAASDGGLGYLTYTVPEGQLLIGERYADKVLKMVYGVK